MTEAAAIDPASDRDLEIMALQLGRTMRGVLGIGARCACGSPARSAGSPPTTRADQ